MFSGLSSNATEYPFLYSQKSSLELKSGSKVALGALVLA